MPGVENYHKHPDKDLEVVLRACAWEKVGAGLWQKGASRLFVDVVGVFFYRLINHRWQRTHGLTHNRITLGPHNAIVFRDGGRLDLRTGDFHEQGHL